MITQEMADQWARLNDMRLDCDLCDVTFSVNGNFFPAHRIVLSCCSRWLRSLLSSSEGDGVIVLDSLDARAVELVIGYLYGEPLTFTPELSEEVIRVIRTFELDEVEVRMLLAPRKPIFFLFLFVAPTLAFWRKLCRFDAGSTWFPLSPPGTACGFIALRTPTTAPL